MTDCFLWLGAFLVSLIPRIGIGIRFLKTKPAGAKAEPWARNFAVGTFTGGLFWAAFPIFLFPGDNIFAQAPIHFILGGLCAGIIVSNGARRPSQMPFVVIVTTAVGSLESSSDRVKQHLGKELDNESWNRVWK